MELRDSTRDDFGAPSTNPVTPRCVSQFPGQKHLGRHAMRLDANVLKDLDWWQWAIVTLLLAAGVTGATWALPAALALCAVMAVGLWGHFGSLTPHAVQLRIASVLVLAVGSLPGMTPLLLVPLTGTLLRTVFGYCPMMRILAILPWNRSLALTRHEAGRILFSWPERGGILATS